MLKHLLHRIALWGLAALTAGAALAQVPVAQTGPSTARRAAAGAWNGLHAAADQDPALVAAGRRIYLEGVSGDGQPVVARRQGLVMRGQAVACVNCHKPSGLGSVEGNVKISPITGRYLFDQDRRAVVQMVIRTIKGFNERHDPYDAGSLAAAITSGRHVSGRELDPLMPRFELAPADLRAVESYLRTLSATWSPGVTEHRIRMATVIASGVDPEQRRIFLQTLRAAVTQKNANIVPGQRSMASAAEMMLRTERYWDLDVWELQGPPETWAAQLRAAYARQPVFALVSGLGGGEWGPVHRFCESERVPCWFPSVQAAPDDAEDGRYGLYFSRGVGLDADVVTRWLTQAGAKGALRQVSGSSDSAQAGARALERAVTAAGGRLAASETWQDAAAVARLLASQGERDVTVLWAGPAELNALTRQTPPERGTVLVPARLIGGEPLALTDAWRARLALVYPWQMPGARDRRQLYFNEWLKFNRIPLEDEFLQSEVYFAMNYFNDTLVDMLDNVHRDYLIERGENMLSLREAAKAEDEFREANSARQNVLPKIAAVPLRAERRFEKAPPRVTAARGETLESRLDRHEGTSVYPRLSLGPGQRFASKGGRIVRFQGADPQALVAETDWIVP